MIDMVFEPKAIHISGLSWVPGPPKKTPKRMEPILARLSVLGYWAILLGIWEVQVPYFVLKIL